jgi:hypothetical protein
LDFLGRLVPWAIRAQVHPGIRNRQVLVGRRGKDRFSRFRCKWIGEVSVDYGPVEKCIGAPREVQEIGTNDEGAGL